jgi:hypothetical protein
MDINKQTRNCLHCVHFCFPGESYYCKRNTFIISHCDTNNNSAITPYIVLLNFNCNNIEYCSEKEFLYNKEIWNSLNPNNIIK